MRWIFISLLSLFLVGCATSEIQCPTCPPCICQPCPSEDNNMAILLDSYSESNRDYDFPLNSAYPNDSAFYYSAVGQTFKPTVNSILTSAKFYLANLGSMTGYITYRLYAHTGTFGTNGYPTGTPLDTSGTLDVATISTSQTLYELTFSGAYNMLANTAYCIVVVGESDLSLGNVINKHIKVGADSSSPTHGGNGCSYLGGLSWNGSSGYDTCFYVYGIIAPTVTTGSATNIDKTTVTLNGEITDLGGENNTVRGFQYKTVTGYELDTHEDGSFGVGTFTLNVTNLFPSMPYSFRAYATNSVGTSYGDWINFETLSPDEEIKRMSRLVYDDLMAYWSEEDKEDTYRSPKRRGVN